MLSQRRSKTDTLSVIDELPERFSRLASQMLREVYNEFGDISPFYTIPVAPTSLTSSFNVDVLADQQAVTVRADVPGLDKDNISITVSDDKGFNHYRRESF
jgi:HSP20 family molecular chaperone IbpA